MRLLFAFVLLMGLGLAGFAVYMVQGYVAQYQTALANEQAERAKQIKLTEVYIATRALAYGEELMVEDAKLVPWPAETLPEGVFQVAETLFPEENAKPRLVLRAMEANEPLLAVKVTQPGEDAGITSRLSKGMRAFAISVDVSSGVSGFLRPGDRVDVYWTGSARGKAKVTKLIEAGVRLIAVDQTADSNRQGPTIARTVTVEASPQQVATLAQAQSTGRLSLSLVGATDETVAAAVEIDQNLLLGIEDEEEQEVVEAEPQEICTIRTRRGADVVEIPIPCTN
ncbi:pilus assembly protein CpaB [Actibacterium mucosum KCTC 23349]|uniref:Pilus assembly protein CpaB n=1 Tax=Actibacterium mucosum KCTC 23349 TaxID=1454373 RepID=A0A037ZGZ2_9RHOB|nr:Flp pilus assembly protein CpaB [Actibacterium mucosum]KAJ54080.1 pilus assembly protein CpaB [Actibacterium mucosum KCTC 23349]